MTESHFTLSRTTLTPHPVRYNPPVPSEKKFSSETPLWIFFYYLYISLKLRLLYRTYKGSYSSSGHIDLSLDPSVTIRPPLQSTSLPPSFLIHNGHFLTYFWPKTRFTRSFVSGQKPFSSLYEIQNFPSGTDDTTFTNILPFPTLSIWSILWIPYWLRSLTTTELDPMIVTSTSFYQLNPYLRLLSLVYWTNCLTCINILTCKKELFLIERWTTLPLLTFLSFDPLSLVPNLLPI